MDADSGLHCIITFSRQSAIFTSFIMSASYLATWLELASFKSLRTRWPKVPRSLKRISESTRRTGTPVYENLIYSSVHTVYVHLIVYAFTTLKFRTECCQHLNESSVLILPKMFRFTYICIIIYNCSRLACTWCRYSFDTDPDPERFGSGVSESRVYRKTGEIAFDFWKVVSPFMKK